MLNDTVSYMLDVVKQIHAHDRWFSDSEGKKTTDLVEKLMRDLGMQQVETLRFPSDGVIDHGGWVMPLCWDARSGTLELLEENGNSQLICSYRETPCALMLYSHPADVETELVLPDTADVKGKIVLFARKMLDFGTSIEYLNRGAVGVACSVLGGSYHGKPGFEYLDDVTQWRNYALPLWDVPQKPFGFSLTPRWGRRLEEMIESGKKVRVRAKVDTTMQAGTIPFVTGVLPGETDEEILLTGHLFEEGANDNATGVAESLAIVRALAGSRLKRGIRLAFTNEARSFQAYLNNVEKVPHVAAGVNVDMVGGALDNHACIQDSDAVFPNFSVSVLKHFLTGQGFVSSILHHPDNDTGLLDPCFNVPMTLVELVNDANYHKSSDTPDTISPEFIGRTFKAVCGFTEFLANAGVEQVKEMAEMVTVYEKEPSHFNGNESPAFARRRGLQRLDSILRLVPAADQQRAAEILAPYKAAMGPELQLEAPDFDVTLLPSGFPVRTYKAFFSFERYVTRKNEFPAIASLISGWVAKLWIQHAMMWADGTRTAAEILNLVRRSGFDIAPELFAELLKFMESEGYLRFQK